MPLKECHNTVRKTRETENSINKVLDGALPSYQTVTHCLFRSRPNVTPLDVRKHNMRIGSLRLDV